MTSPKEIKPRTVTSESELHHVLKNYMPNSQSHGRKTLIEGFNIIRTRMEAKRKIAETAEENFGGYIPATLNMDESLITLDKFIKNSLGGVRDGLRIYWIINGVKYLFDPFSGNIKSEPA